MIGGPFNAAHHSLRMDPCLLLEKKVTNDNKMTGRIIKLSKSGWGFITSRDIEFTRIFFHWTSLTQDTLGFKELHTGMHVEFTPLEVVGKGFRAVHVRVVPKEKKDEPTDQMPSLSE